MIIIDDSLYNMQVKPLTNWQQALRLLPILRELSTSAREQKLEELSHTQPDLYLLLKSLLKREVEHSPLDRIPQQLLGINVNLGTQYVGDYQLLEEISASSMGTVYRAQRADGRYQQQVAIKLLAASENPGMHQHFIRERRLLAELEHPHITRILDAGEFDNDIPYVVMEWVDGINILDYCRLHKLTLAERLELFQKVCQAIHYAHQHLIVHGDIKPGNILVNHDGSPKLLDFGIAHRLNEHQRDTSLFTAGYASPEQLNQQPISTASDIFSLGLLLFECSYLQHAFPLTENFALWKQQLLTDNPDLPTPHQQASLNIPQHWRADLQAVCQQALAKTANNRYSSAEVLNQDIHNILTHQSVSSRQPGWLNSIHKLYYRHPLATLFATATGLITIVALITLSIQHHQLQNALTTSEEQRKTAETTKNYIQDIILEADPHTQSENKNEGPVTLEQIMLHGVDQLDQRFPNDPNSKADLAYTLGRVLANQGRYQQALQVFEKVFDSSNEELRGKGLREQANSLLLLKQFPQAWDKTQAAEQYLIKSKDAEWAENRFIQSTILTQQSRFKEAAELLEETLSSVPDLPVDLTLDKHIVLGTLYWSQAKLEQSLVNYRNGYELALSAYGEQHHQSARFLYAQAVALHRLGRFNEASSAYKNAAQIQEQVYAPNHPTIANTYGALAAMLYDQGLSHEALPYFVTSLEYLRGSQSRDTARLIRVQGNYALTLHDLGQFDLAEDIYHENMQLSADFYGLKTLEYAAQQNNLGFLYLDTQQAQKALPLLQSSYAIFNNLQHENNHSLSFCQLHLARAFWQTERPVQAKQWLQLSIDNRRQLGNGKHSILADALIWQARIALVEQDFELAKTTMQEALQIRQQNFSAKNWRVSEARVLNSIVDHMLSPDSQDYLKQIHSALQDMIDTRGKNDWRVQRLRADLEPVTHLLHF